MYRLTLSGGMWQLLWGTCTFAISLKLGLGQIPLTWYEGESAWNKGNVPAFVQVHWCLRVGLSHPEVEFHIFPQALQVQDLWGSSHRLLYRSPAEGRKLAQCPGEGGGVGQGLLWREGCVWTIWAGWEGVSKKRWRTSPAKTPQSLSHSLWIRCEPVNATPQRNREGISCPDELPGRKMESPLCCVIFPIHRSELTRNDFNISKRC